jgi:hypothetical protein
MAMHQTPVARLTQALLYAVFCAGCALWIALPFFLDRLLILFDDVFTALPSYKEFITVFLMMAGAAGLFIIFELIRIFRTLSGDPFVPRNVKILKRIGVSALVITALFMVKCVVFFTTMTLVCSLLILLLSLFAFVLSNLFEKAVEYKIENDLTI